MDVGEGGLEETRQIEFVKHGGSDTGMVTRDFVPKGQQDSALGF